MLIGERVQTDLQIQNEMTMSAWIYPTAYPVDLGDGGYGMIMGSQQDGASAGAALFYAAESSLAGVPPGSVIFNLGTGSSFAGIQTQSQYPTGDGSPADPRRRTYKNC